MHTIPDLRLGGRAPDEIHADVRVGPERRAAGAANAGVPRYEILERDAVGSADSIARIASLGEVECRALVYHSVLVRRRSRDAVGRPSGARTRPRRERHDRCDHRRDSLA